MNWTEHIKNRNEFPQDELLKYEGQHVAWSRDGKSILASDADPVKMMTKLREAGFSSDDYILSIVGFDSEIGGAAFNEDNWEVDE